MFSKATIAAAALAAAAVPAMAGGSPKLNLYWGQGGGSNPEFDIDYYCKNSKPDMISMAFMNVSPEHAGGKYGGTNFANHCSLKYYKDGGVDTKLLDCTEMIAGVHKCQKNYGVKILLSIGGVYSDQNNYSISSKQKGEEWATWLWQAYGPKPDNYDGPRPLDSDTEEFIIDGFDFDLEFPAKMTSAEGSYWAAMVAKLRSLSSDCGRSVYLTAAPQCPLSSTWFFMDTLLAKAAFDALFIQFYNNPACDAIPNNTPGDAFGYKAWEAYAAAGVQKDAKLFIGLPAASDISGYLDRDSLKQVICEVLDDATCTNFGGISLWDAGRAWANVADGKNYMEYAQYLLNGGCHPTTTTSTTTTSSSTTSVADTTTSAADTTTSSAADTTTSSAADTTTTTCDTTSTSETTSSEATTSSATTSESTTGISDSTSADATSTSTSASATGTSSNTSTADYPEPTGDDDDDDDECDDDDDDDDDGDDGEHTHTHTHTGTATKTGGHHHTTKAPYTTSTVYTTTVYTVTSCPPEKGGCHPGAVTTEVIALTTTVCPVTEASPTPTGHGCTGENCGGSGSGHSGSGGSGNSGSGHSGSGGSGSSGSGHSGSGGSGSSGSSGSSGGSGCTGAGCGSSESSTFMTKAAPATSAPSSGFPKPTGSSSGSSSGCTGAGCPSTTVPVTAGAGNVAFSIVAVLAAAIFAL